MLLYNAPVSGNCYKVRLLLAQLGIGYERQEVDVFDRSDRPELLGGLNPALRVPTLVLDDDRSLAESSASGTRSPTAPFAYTHVAPEGGFTLQPYPAVSSWLTRVAAQPGHIDIAD